VPAGDIALQDLGMRRGRQTRATNAVTYSTGDNFFVRMSSAASARPR
jgi:hypothetical protein